MQKKAEVEDKLRRRKEGWLSLTKDLIKEAFHLGIWVESRSRVLVLVFINWSLYKKNNLVGFSSEVEEVLALADILYFVSLISLSFVLW